MTHWWGYGCLLVVIGNGADRQRKGQDSALGYQSPDSGFESFRSLALRCRRCSSSRATLMICWISSPAGADFFNTCQRIEGG
jgi:hypothetical protein